VKVNSALGKRAFAEWLSDNDQETLELLMEIGKLGPAEQIRYQNYDEGKQQELLEHMKAARENAATNAIRDSKRALRG
jgi:hypothetical protein